MAQFATTFGSQETKAKAKTRGASYSHRFISRPFLVQSFDAGNGTTLNLMRDYRWQPDGRTSQDLQGQARRGRG